ncbi:MAG: sodium:proton antiporter NhaD [Pseudomonadales bacterium]|nr:sodium:proton antiporter NhaD [Pseudomonadales bacterium]
MFFSALSLPLLASGGAEKVIDLTTHWVGYAAMGIFVFAYTLVIFEEQIHLAKSKPVMMSAALIWMLIAIIGTTQGFSAEVEAAVHHGFLEYAELFFFLLVAMTYINAMLERGVFDALRAWLVGRGFSYKQMFWLTGVLAFVISPIADNLTTALILCAVVLAVGKESPAFISLACINIVVSANAGGAFSPFGDITTLMVWQKGILEFTDFFQLFLPSLVNFIIPALIMQFAIPNGQPAADTGEKPEIQFGGFIIVGLFLCTILTAVLFHTFLHLPPVFGMMTGLGYLKMFGYVIQLRHKKAIAENIDTPDEVHSKGFDIFENIAKSEWDTLFFFYGVIMSVGGLAFIGYLGVASEMVYGQLGATTANILVGLLSAIVDNIPVMFAVLTMEPEMSSGQWLLVTLTAGVGGSLLSVGSAAGVALMGQARGYYTFASHLKWMPVIALGYAASIAVHIWLNGV